MDVKPYRSEITDTMIAVNELRTVQKERKALEELHQEPPVRFKPGRKRELYEALATLMLCGDKGDWDGTVKLVYDRIRTECLEDEIGEKKLSTFLTDKFINPAVEYMKVITNYYQELWERDVKDAQLMERENRLKNFLEII